MTESTEEFTTKYLNEIEVELRQIIERPSESINMPLNEMLVYHMGWTDKTGRSHLKGKRIRPLLTLLSCSAAGGNWREALPAAAAVELVHNFSLIHDDIEDHSSLRRGRMTVWKKWGIAQAINAGDAMFTLAHLQPIRLRETISPESALHAVDVLQQACLHLTQGQYLDLAFEKRFSVTTDEYWTMVEGKTAALISAGVELGAICARADEQICAKYRSFGRLFGLAFQAMDDYLGIWGNSVITGKSNQSDLFSGKKTLPIIYGIAKGDKFAEHWLRKPIRLDDIEELTGLLDREGGKEYTINTAANLIEMSLSELDLAQPSGQGVIILKDLAMSLLSRQS